VVAGITGGLKKMSFWNRITFKNKGKTVSQTVNANGNYNFGLYSNYNFKWKKPNIRISFGPNGNVSRNISFVNGQKAVNTNTSYGFQFGISKEIEDKYDISINPEISWVKANNSISSSASASYWQAGIRADVELTFLKKFIFESDVNFKAKQKDPRFPANNQFTLWNASLSRFLYKEVLEAKVSVNDILSENRGYERTFNDYRYTETFYNTLTRFWMVTLTWNFSKNGKPTSD